MTRAQAYAAKLDLLTRQADELSPEARREILVLLDSLNREILSEVSRVDPSSYTAARLAMLRSSVERLMAQFADQASSRVEKLQEKAWRQTGGAVDAAVAAGTGTVVVPPVLDATALRVVQGYTADLITGLSRDSSAKITAAIQRAYLGQSTLSQLVQQIGSELEGGTFSGLFSPIGERAMGIATNEVMRVQSLATMARIRALAPRHANLMKQWRHLPIAKVPRITHILADKQIRKPEEPFLVGAEELMYPRDPSGSPGNTINCHCLVQPYLPEDHLKPTDAEREMLQKLGVSAQPAPRG